MKKKININFFRQNDAQEFLLFFLDELHEELKRKIKISITGKIINEKDKMAHDSIISWKNNFENNYSKIIELFYGQIISIIKGDMVFVGPRPALFNQYDLIDMRSERGISILKPGITGWAQVNGRDELSIKEKVELDAEYVLRKSIRFDLYIIWLTLLKVIKKEGVSH